MRVRIVHPPVLRDLLLLAAVGVVGALFAVACAPDSRDRMMHFFFEVPDKTTDAGDTALARIIRLVQQAQTRRAPIEAFVDRFARYYTPTVTALAAPDGLFADGFESGNVNAWSACEGCS